MSTPNILLDFIKATHTFLDIFYSSYIFIFPKKYDKYYITLLLFIILHWYLLKNECILSYIEKKLIDKDYILGSYPYHHPFRDDMPDILDITNHILKNINILVVFYRNRDNKYIITCSILIIFLSIVNIIRKPKTIDSESIIL